MAKRHAVKDFKQIILDEVNIKDIEFVTEDDKLNNKAVTVNFRKAGAVLKGDVNKLKNALQAMPQDKICALSKLVEDGKNVQIDGFPELTSDMIDVKLTPKDEFAIANLGNNLVVLDVEIDQNLADEGKLRELVRELQVARKEAGFNIDDRIALNLKTDDERLKKIIDKNLKNINAEVLCTSNAQIESGFEKEIQIDNAKVVIKMKK